jgi:general L-amino acid transport system substrate-binding protein
MNDLTKISRVGAAGVALATLLVSSLPAAAESGDTMKAIKARGELLCGVHPSRPGFAAPDDKGNWTGFEADYCRALAAVVFGDATKVRFVALSSQQRFPGIQSGEVDVLARNVTATMGRDVALGLNFTPPIFYTGTGFLVHVDSGIEKLEDLNGATICMAPGSTTEQNIASLFSARGLTYTPIVIEDNKQLVANYVEGRCDALAKDKAALPGVRAIDTENPAEHKMLPGIYSKEPLAMAVRQGDDQWYDLVKWTVYATFNGEEMGVSQENVDEMLKSPDPDIQIMLGVTGDLGEKLGVSKDWAYQVVKQVGNYKDIYMRHFGPGTPIELDRDLNKQWGDGGILYGFPIK